jgi:hypothetical protein
MSKEWQENRDTADTPTPTASEKGPSPEGMRAIQGKPETAEGQPPQDWPTDRTFQDRQGRDVTLRTYSYGDQHDIRAYDRAKMEPPERTIPVRPAIPTCALSATAQKRVPACRTSRARRTMKATALATRC